MNLRIREERCEGKPKRRVRLRHLELYSGTRSGRGRAEDIPRIALIVDHDIWQVIINGAERQNSAIR